MKLNTKGFMLAEVTIVSAIAVVIMVTMFVSSSKMIKAYESRDNYYNVDSIYATGYIYDYLMDNLIINDYLIELDGSSTLKYLDLKGKNIEYINNIVSLYDLDSVFIIKNSDIDAIVSDGSLHKTMRSYIDNYVRNNIDDINGHSIVVERKKDSINYYYYFIEL